MYLAKTYIQIRSVSFPGGTFFSISVEFCRFMLTLTQFGFKTVEICIFSVSFDAVFFTKSHCRKDYFKPDGFM